MNASSGSGTARPAYGARRGTGRFARSVGSGPMPAEKGDARDRAAEILLQVERRGGFVRDLLPDARAEVDDPRERGLLTELGYGPFRRLGTIGAVLAAHSRRPLPKLDPAVRVALRLALHQVLFLDRVPPHAAVDRAVGWVRGRVGAWAAGYANAVLR